jgi:hypothetical protein
MPSMNFLATLRYLVFAIFIVCNAILASVAVWNSSLDVSSSNRESHVDVYEVVVGALGLALVFTIIFVELVRRNAFTSRVWFECLWTTIFFGLYLGGAVVLSVVGVDEMCESTTQSKNSESQSLLPPGTCASSQVLLGFTWSCTFVLLMYLILLVTLTFANRNNESVPRIWECTVHNFPPLTSRRSNTPAAFLPRFTQDKTPEVVSPAPRRPGTVPSALYTLRSFGLNSQYQIEHFRPPSHTSDPPMLSNPVTSPADYLHRNPSNPGHAMAAVALYPQFLSSAYVPPARMQPPPMAAVQSSHRLSRSPPPLGDWPRADAPLRIKRKNPPPMGLAEQTAAGSASSRPMGPRTRAGTTHRPPPLNLT